MHYTHGLVRSQANVQGRYRYHWDGWISGGRRGALELIFSFVVLNIKFNFQEVVWVVELLWMGEVFGVCRYGSDNW